MATATKKQSHTADSQSKSTSEKGSKTTTNHDVIKAWAEKRKGKPSVVKGTGSKKQGIGILRIDFPGYSGEDSLEPITWEEFFKAFDESNLEFLYQEKTADGKEGNFNKFVAREG
jgi:hypothetical protein